MVYKSIALSHYIITIVQCASIFVLKNFMYTTCICKKNLCLCSKNACLVVIILTTLCTFTTPVHTKD